MLLTLEQMTHDNYRQALAIDREDIPEAWVDSAASLMKVTDYGAEHHLIGHTYIAYWDGKPVGLIMIGEALAWDTDPDEMKDKPFYRVMGFVVDKDYRNRGIGGEILETAVARVYSEFGERSLALGVHKDNTRVGRFYERHGFKRTGVYEGNDEYYLRLIDSDLCSGKPGVNGLTAQRNGLNILQEKHMNITVYLGANEGNDPSLKKAVRELGAWIGNAGHALVYGGSKSGLMGELAESVLHAGGKVTGVEPQFFIDAGFEYNAVTELIVTKDMTDRKAKMIELGGAFIAFPGGTGTLEEIAEVMSKVSLGHLDKPCILYNLNGYYDGLKAQLAHMIDLGLSSEERQRGIYFADNLEDIRRIVCCR